MMRSGIPGSLAIVKIKYHSPYMSPIRASDPPIKSIQ
jgi:hypothetical protein